MVVAACGLTASTGGDRGDAATDVVTDVGPPDAGPLSRCTGDGVCNNVANIAQTIQVGYVASDPPAAQGGSIVDGIYALTAARIYVGIDGGSGPIGPARITLQIMGSTIDD
jgi:hypothetical protein